MIMQDNEKKPALRFKGFTDPWEQRKLGEIAVEKLSNGVMNHPASNATGVRHINVINMYTPDKIHLEDLTFSSYDGDVIQKCNVEIGDIFLTRSSLKPEGIAEANVLLDDGRFIYDDHLIRLKINKNEYVPLFVKINLGVPFIKVQFISKSKTTAFTTIGQDDISECVGLFPEKEEQQKIAIFFHNLNTLITLHQRKYEKLVNIKKSMLNKMFPQNGASVPEIRFKDFTDPWEQRKISELAEKTYGGGTPTTSNETFWNGNIPWIQSSDIVDGKLMGVEPRKYITQTGLNSSATQLVPKNSIAIITRVGVGKLAYMPFSYSTSQDFLSLSKLNTEPFFTVYACYKKLQSELNTVQGTSIKGITKDELLAKTISVPVYSEQKQIGSFFAQLDTLITLHQRKLEKLQNIKKSCLEKMFA